MTIVPPQLPRLSRVAVTGLLLVSAIAAAGRLSERIVLGPDDQAARARIAADVRDAFDVMARGLQVLAARVGDADALLQAANGDEAAAQRLFELARTATAVSGDDVELAVTAYSADGRTQAWVGRPSELPADRLRGDEAWFIAQGAAGLRLVYTAPVVNATGAWVGTIAAERSIRPSDPTGDEPDDQFVFPGQPASVTLELAFEEVRTAPDPDRVDVVAPNGRHLVTAVITEPDLMQARARWRRAAATATSVAGTLFALLLYGPLLDWRDGRRRRDRTVRHDIAGTFAIAGIIVVSRALLRLAPPADWTGFSLFSADAYASSLLRPLLVSPFDFLATAAAAGALVALGASVLERVRVRRGAHRRGISTPAQAAAFLTVQVAAAIAVTVLLIAHHGLLSDTVANTRLDLLHYSLHPWNPALLSLQMGLVLWGAAGIAAAVVILRGAGLPWRIARRSWPVRLLLVACWVSPLLLSVFGVERDVVPSIVGPVTLAVATALLADRIKARFRHGSQAFRLVLLAVGLVLPALTTYPAVFRLARAAKMELVETRYGPQVLNQRRTIQELTQQSLREIDMFPGLTDLVSIPPDPPGSEALTDRSYQVWRVTGLAAYPITSSVELFGADGRLVSRFAFNFPDDLNAVPTSEERSCTWDVFEEVSPFFAVERRVLSAGRAVCVAGPDGRSEIVGSIVVHALLDYDNLPFIASKNPYVELLRPAEQDEGVSGGDVEFAVYGWSRTPLYMSSDTSWELTDTAFTALTESRTPRWVRLVRGGQSFDVYLLNDRGGVYALGFPVVTPLGHLMNLAELTVLAAVTSLVLLLLATVLDAMTRRTVSARALLREIRASFYRKLFLAFVATTCVPVVALAVVSTRYIADQMRANVEQEAVRTAAAAQRVVEDLVAPRAARQGIGIDDNLLVWVSRLIDQDVNIFIGPRLLATSERNLFASGVLPVRTPAEVFRTLELQHEATTVSREQIAGLDFLLAATRMSAPPLNATLTVPLTSRAKDIEAQIDALDRIVLLATLLFILAGAGIGYSMAERIADPVSRLTRATRRVARGDLDARVVAASSDELGRLVDDFNRMAHELAGQREQRERANRLEAWAEMARQVAHEIKNPLTPIQLNAEHIRRVNADKGQPLSPVLEQSVAAILTQVKLLRQIAAEFSNFASSPTVRRTAVDLGQMLHDVLEPYQSGTATGISLQVQVPDALPPVRIDRTLITRAITNIVENALHAIGTAGTLTVAACAVNGVVEVAVSDTGAGMDADAIAHAFEPYFSTKASGTGLGLPIARRNVELNGGTIAIDSDPRRGTTVTVTLPVEPPAA